MTLYQVITAMETAIAKQPNIRTLIRADVYKLESLPQVWYPVMAWTMNTHRINLKTGIATYSINLYYIDRNSPDSIREHEIVSFGTQVINNVVFTIRDEGIYIDEYDIQPFVQKFSDDCAGVYAILNIDVPIDYCYEEYTLGDYNNDHNVDYLIGTANSNIKIY